jgi:hypothetical protein
VKMKILRSKFVVPIAFIVYGLFYFFEPVVSAWLEVVSPSIAATTFLPIQWVTFLITLPIYFIASAILGEENSFAIAYMADVLFLLVFLCYIAYFVRVITKKWSAEHKKVAVFPLIAFPIFWLALLPIGATKIERHVNAFSIGGWSRVMFAGGPKMVREGGIKLLESVKQGQPTDEEIPPSIDKLGYWVQIEHDPKLVLVGAGQMFGMADAFGFIIPEENGRVPLPHYLEESEFYRIWKIADGVYFFEH